MKTLIKILLFLAYLVYSVAAGAQTIQGYMKYRFLDVSDALSIPADSTQLAAARKDKPHIAVVEDSLFMIWSVAQQRYILPRSSALTSVNFSDVLGDPHDNANLDTALDARQLLLPKNNLGGYYLGGDHQLYNLDSLLGTFDFVKSTDSVFLEVQQGTTIDPNDIPGLTTYIRNTIFGGTAVIYNPATGVIAIDSALIVDWLSGSISGGVTQEQLDDTAAAIRADFPSASTPTIEQVLTAGSNLSSSKTIEGTGTLKINPTIGFIGQAGFDAGQRARIEVTSNNEVRGMSIDAATANDYAYFSAFNEVADGEGGSAELYAHSLTDNHALIVTEDAIKLQRNTGASNLNLILDNLPSSTTGYVLYIDNTTGVVTKGSAPAGGGGSSRFGVSGEDELSTAARLFDMDFYNFRFKSSSTIPTFQVTLGDFDDGSVNPYSEFTFGSDFYRLYADDRAGTHTQISASRTSPQVALEVATPSILNQILLQSEGILFFNTNGAYYFGNVPTYADDTAAGVGGVLTGYVYKTSTGQLMIKL